MFNQTLTQSTDVSALSDQALYQKAKLYGRSAIEWRQKFMGLLPEVARRKLYEKKGFHSVYEFAYKLAGLSEQQVRTAINLDKQLSDKPVLRELFQNGKVSIHKLVRVKSIATRENEKDWAELVQNCTQGVVETLVRDEAQKTADSQNENGLPKPLFEVKPLRTQDLNLSAGTLEKLLKLQEKGIDLDELINEMLDKREKEIEEEKQEISANVKPTDSKYINVRTRRVLKEEYGTKCSAPGCNKPAEAIHHTLPFALAHIHDPNFLAPLCKAHHQIAHSINLKVLEKRKNAAQGR